MKQSYLKRAMALVAAFVVAAARPAVAQQHGLGPFAHVSWTSVFDRTPSLHYDVVDGRRYYRFASNVDSAGGTPYFPGMAVGRVGPQHTWLAAIPFESGGSGGAFFIAVYAYRGAGVHFIGILTDGDRLGAQIYGGLLHEITPARTPEGCNACYTSFRIYHFTLDGSRLKRVGAGTVPVKQYFAAHPPPSE